MGVYLERLRSEFDEITDSIDSVLERAADAGRDLTDEENAQIEREDLRRDQLQKAIDTQAALLDRSAKVSARLDGMRMPAPRHRVETGAPQEPGFDLAREIPSAGAWASMMNRVWVRKDPAAVALLERATAHQTTADNPGLIPYPLVGPLVDRMRNTRPFIQSLGDPNPAPAPKFDRPVVTQDVAVDEQANEKDLTASQKMIVDTKAVTLKTWAGHVNLSRQDIRWSSPSLIDLIYQSFVRMYARRSDRASATSFAAAVTQTDTLATLDVGAIDDVIGDAGTTIGGAYDDMGELNHAWMSRDVAKKFAKLRDSFDKKLYNIPLVNGTSGDIDGLPVSISGRLPAGTFILGDDTLVEYWEDMEGFLTVAEPDVLGQMVGYAGYGSVCVVDATGFVKVTVP